MSSPFNECLIHVYWTGASSGDGGGHTIMRGKVSADLGLPVPDPPFTTTEMEEITFAAKMQALKSLRKRKVRKV